MDPIQVAAGGASALIKIGEPLWRAMNGNKVTVQASNSVSVLPDGAKSTEVIGWTRNLVQLEYKRDHFKLPTVKVNLYHWWKYGGRYKGSGQYIKDARVKPTGRGRFGDTVNVDVSTEDPENDAPLGLEPLISLPFTVTIEHRELAVYEFKYQGNGGHQVARLTPAAVKHLTKVREGLPKERETGRTKASRRRGNLPGTEL